MNDITNLMELSDDVDAMIVVSPKDLANALHDWLHNLDNYAPSSDLDLDDDVPVAVGVMVPGGDWINLFHALKSVPQLIEMVSE
jgi:hypothetical protein